MFVFNDSQFPFSIHDEEPFLFRYTPNSEKKRDIRKKKEVHYGKIRFFRFPADLFPPNFRRNNEQEIIFERLKDIL
ncbi:hypothetical protein CH375_05740 [Leptospira ellisii]|uniref:Uncharacterized protein n=1 Tax=Leptospira ellisii TaxID=2023197 RepID=A0A2N0BDH3_9LEPT|nr:hypothetical protein CH379_01885 [Leptospira ellisii]PKA05334.1 hypothetical protein CH375_05740 [Leptospira ellisii]